MTALARPLVTLRSSTKKRAGQLAGPFVGDGVSGGEAAERATDVAFSQALESAVAELSYARASDAEHGADLFERVFASAIETEIQSQHLRVTRRQRTQCLFDLIVEESVHRLFLSIRHFI